YSTMNRRKLDKLRREHAAMRRSPQDAASLQSLANRLGRKAANSRGKHPNWESSFDHVYPVSIPDHRGDIPTGTKNRILDCLEEDILAWDEILPDDFEEDT